MKRKTTDFSAILEELRSVGINDYKMAELTGIDRSMLSKLRSGDRKQPNYDDGVAIMEIYVAEISGKT
jgi:transcriptional regulator with XRE-family HTH domain